MKKILLTTFGTWGDVHPFIAIALALQARGYHPVLTVLPEQTSKVEGAGLEAAAAGWSVEEIKARTGKSEVEFAHAVMRDINYLIRALLLPQIEAAARTAAEAGRGSVAVVGSTFGVYGGLAAEMLGVPYISGILQPTSLPTAADPPRGQLMNIFAPRPATALGLAWNRLMLASMRGAIRLMYARPVDKTRLRLGLPKSRQPIVVDEEQAALRLFLYPRMLGPEPAPSGVHFTGSCLFDSESGQPETLDPVLARFLDEGQSPLVFTLGSFSTYAPAEFYEASAKAARALGRRAILLASADVASSIAPASDRFVTGYVPHSLLFSRAAAVVHHGGIGTTCQALRAGVRQLVVPHLGDQWDNGARVRRLGLGEVLDHRRYGAAPAAAILGDLLQRPIEMQLASRANEVKAERGAEAAADLIESVAAKSTCP